MPDAREDPVAVAAPVPVTLVTGFLGAGKTTLVNRMLRNADGLRLAVLVNDFGAVNIDAELIEGTADTVVALRNGCICCSLTGGLLAAVSGVLRRPRPPDAIVVEGSGVSDPAEVARALADPDLQRHAPLDGIVTVIDAAGLAVLRGEARALAERQIATADLVLLNKADLADDRTLGDVERRIAALAPGARYLRSVDADVPLALLIGVDRPAGGAPPPAPPLPAEAAFESAVVEIADPIPTQRLLDLLSGLPAEVYRAKGIVHLAERPETRCILQATGRRASITIGARWGGDPPLSRLVFIGARGVLDRTAIERHLRDGAG